MQYKLNSIHLKKIIALVTALVANTALATHIVSLTIQPYPISEKNIDQQIKQNLNKGTHLQRFAKESSLVSGIFSTYAGYISISDYTGRITFPRMQQSARLYLIVTQQINPIMMLGNTIHHWELNKGEPVKIVLAEQKIDEETDLLYWDLQEAPIPADNIIPLASITILASPEHMYIPLGITPTKQSPHLILPDIYIKPEFNKVAESLYLLNLSPFFGSLSLHYRLHKKDISSIMKL
ncbi:MAG: hypothetical protein M1114_06585 [Candidatus Dependentiae bacterium]|nr:hypothetical protein [Candidatus Dependentiae bacterium]